MRAGTLGQLVTFLVIALWLGLYALPYLAEQVQLWRLRRRLAREFNAWAAEHAEEFSAHVLAPLTGTLPFRLYVPPGPPAGSPQGVLGEQWTEHGRWAGVTRPLSDDELARLRAFMADELGVVLPLPPSHQNAERGRHL